MTGIAQLWSPMLMRAAGFTLLHSLWQGALVALLTSVLLLALHRRSAHLRYQLTVSGLFIFVGLAALTFGHYCLASPPPAVAPSTLVTSPLATLVAAEPAAHSRPLEFVPGQTVPALLVELLTRGSHYIDQHLALLLGAWLLGVLGMSLRFMAGLSYVRRLRRYRVDLLPGYWQEKVNELARRVGLRHSVQVLTSALVTSPLVVGHFKPVILVPLGAVAGLSPSEVEMIFAHEIAHVVRKDYLVNLLQSVAEIVFFYHPAVWFLSASLRTERENCCDDIATQLCGDSLLLARALSSLAEWTYATQVPRLAVAARGPRGSLLSRVQRLIHFRPTTPSLLESVGVVGVVLGSAAVIIASTLLSLGAVAKPSSERSLNRSMGGQPLAPVLKNTASRLHPRHPHSRPGGPAGDDLRLVFENQLLLDKLIPSREHYTYTLTTREFSVNGQLQPKNVAERYRVLYATAAGKILGATESYQTTKKSQHTSISTPMASSQSITPPQASALTTTTVVTPPVTPTPPPNTEVIAQALRQDGLLASNTKAFELILDQDGLRVNGQAQSVAMTEKYRSLLHAPVDPAGHTHTAVTIRVTD